MYPLLALLVLCLGVLPVASSCAAVNGLGDCGNCVESSNGTATCTFTYCSAKQKRGKYTDTVKVYHCAAGAVSDYTSNSLVRIAYGWAAAGMNHPEVLPLNH
jgi:hypothetical protein